MANASASITHLVTKANGDKFFLSTAQDTTSCYVVSKPFAFDKPSMLKYIDYIRAEVFPRTGIPDLYLEIYTLESANDPNPVLVTKIPLNNTTNPLHPPDQIPDSAYFQFIIRDEKVKTNWKLTAFEVYGMETGEAF